MTINYFRTRSACLLGVVFLAHTACCISVASTPAPYTASSPSNEYASPTTPEPATPDYNNYNNKYSNPLYPPYSRPVYDPMYNPQNNHLTETFTPYSSLLSPRPFLFHRLPSIFNAPIHSPHNPESAPYPYNVPAYPTQSGFVPSPQYEPPQSYPQSYPYTYPKYPKNPYAPSCDYQHVPPYRNSKPLYYYPQRPENVYDYQQLPSKPSDALYRYQPVQPSVPAYSNTFPNSGYH